MSRVKFLLIGDFGTGKTCLARRYVHRQFSQLFKSTIGVDISSKSVEVPGKGEIEIQLWDVSGQPSFEKARKQYILNAQPEVALLIFDLTKPESFNNIPKWISEIEQKIGKVPMTLVGAKSDLLDQDNCLSEAILEFARENDLKYFKTSAKTGEKVDEAFSYLLELTLKTTEILASF